MRGSVRYIGMIDRGGAIHHVEFQEGINIITGKSSTGKSAMIEIFDYCFGNSEYTVPEGVITDNAKIYFLVIAIKESYLVLARRPKSKHAYINECTDKEFVADVNNFNEDYFDDFIQLSDFKKELSKFLGIEITDIDENLEERESRGQKLGRPTARHLTSFMLQHQNLIANKHSLFYRFDEKEKREQTIDQFKIFAGFVDQEYFIKKQELNDLEKQLKILQAQADRNKQNQTVLAEKIDEFKDEYEAITGEILISSLSQEMLKYPKRTLKSLYSKQITTNLESDKYLLTRKKIIADENKIVAEIRSEQNALNNVQYSIQYAKEYKTKSNELDRFQRVEIPESTCPFCHSEHTHIIQEGNYLKEAMNWLNEELSKTSYMMESLRTEEFKIRRNIEGLRGDLRKVTQALKENDEIIKQLQLNRSLSDQAQKVKFKIENILEEILSESESGLSDSIISLKERIKDLELFIATSYNVTVKLKEAERIINERMKEIGEHLDFEFSYRPINLKFSLETFELYHQKEDGSRVYLRSMGSGANWLYSHICLFTALQYYFCSIGDKSLMPPVLFLDQPSQVYFPSNIDNSEDEFDPESLKKSINEADKYDEDLGSVTNMFDQLIRHVNETRRDTGITPQIIITDHADKLKLADNIDFEKLVAGRRWRKRGFIENPSNDLISE